MLPSDFEIYTSSLFGDSRWQQYLTAFNEAPPVSIRLNPFKTFEPARTSERLNSLELARSAFEPSFSSLELTRSVPWSRHAFYLAERPNFTLDPLFHAGAYYVQEASSMFLDHVLTSLVPSSARLSTYGAQEPAKRLEPFEPFELAHEVSDLNQREARLNRSEGALLILDLCAAPGGKSTLLRAALPDDAMLFSNEPDRRRAHILMENMQKQGHPNVIVTNNYPRDYRKAGMLFDMILADVPCSGEGMFRKDPKTISEWSVDNVIKCQQLQRSIIHDIWPCLKPGGILIYSTCTFNTRENEENIQWIIDHFQAQVINIPVNPEWHITGSLLPSFSHPVYRFIPGITQGEGLFMAVLQNPLEPFELAKRLEPARSAFEPAKRLNCLHNGTSIQPTIKGKKVIPNHTESLSIATPKDKYPRVELSKDEALRYLRHEALILPPDTPRGYVIVTYAHLPLGFVNNIGTRANNLYPKEWKIRNL